MTKTEESNRKWKAENTESILIRFYNKPDADILATIKKPGTTRQAEIKRLIRIAIAMEQNETK